MAVETSTFGAITRFISSFAKSLWHTWNRKWIVSITIFKYLIKYLWWCSIYQKMKRFAAVLDASLNDNEGEQGGLVAFPHRVLQPDNDMVYIYIYNNKSSAAWQGGEIRNFFQSFNNYWQLSIVNIMESLPSLYSSNRLCWTFLIGIDDVTDLMMSRWFLLVGQWKISTIIKTMVTFNTSIFMAQSSIRRPSSVAALIWNSILLWAHQQQYHYHRCTITITINATFAPTAVVRGSPAIQSPAAPTRLYRFWRCWKLWWWQWKSCQNIVLMLLILSWYCYRDDNVMILLCCHESKKTKPASSASPWGLRIQSLEHFSNQQSFINLKHSI